MQKFTVTEISWIIGELSKTAENLKNQAGKEENAGIAAGFMNLRSDIFFLIWSYIPIMQGRKNNGLSQCGMRKHGDH